MGEVGKSGPTIPKSTEQEEQIICEFRRVTKFTLDIDISEAHSKIR